jgi:hypothetical protein
MIEFGGTIYYIDLEAMDKTVNKELPSGDIKTKELKTYLDENGKIVSAEIYEHTTERTAEVSAAKYDFIRLLLEIVMDDDPDETDATLGPDRILDKTPLSYRIAFNTLLKYGILKEEE